MKVCPVCNATLADNFALQGHLRLSMDSAHIKFKQQHTKNISQKAVFTDIESKIHTGNNLLESLETLIKSKEFLDEEELRGGKILIEIKKIVEAERKIEKEYQHLIEQIPVEVEEEKEKIRTKIMQNYHGDVNREVAKIREEMAQKQKKIINDNYKQWKNEGFWEAILLLPCFVCGRYIQIQPGTDLHRYLADAAISMQLVAHPECRRSFNQQRAAYQWEQEQIRIEYLEEELRRLQRNE